MTTTLNVPAVAAPETPVDEPASRPRSRWQSFVRGRDSDPAWARPALLALLASTALLYLWGLGASGWANSFYTAAVQAASTSWKAFFFGSFDSSNFITVDKPPAALWVMALSARIFGVNAWSILVPQALMGVASVGLLYATVRRRFSPGAALIAGAVLALTPVATLMFRFNNPDALLTLLLVGAAYAVVRALEHASTRWLVFAAALVGTAFITKMLQAFVVVPGFALVYLFAAPTALRRRLVQLAYAGVGLVVASGWWVAIVELVPASARPYIGGSQNNSVLDLVFGYNGFGRITGDETGSVGGGAAGTAGRWGATGITRMFGSEFGGQVSWLIPAALVFLVALLWLSRRVPRTDGRRAQVLVWGSWLVVTGLVFSYMRGIIHPYYAVALAPAIGALVGIGTASLWRHRDLWAHRVVLAVALAVTVVWSYVLLDRSPAWHPGLRTFVVIAGLGAAVAVLAAPWLTRRTTLVLATTALFVGLAGPAAYSLETASTAHTGAIPSAGPAVTGARVGPGGTRGGFAGGPPGAFGGAPQGMQAPQGMPMQGTQRQGGMGGLLDSSQASSELVSLLQADSDSYRWVAATVGANNAAGYQLSSDRPVMALGGFNGTDPTPTLAQFQAYVQSGQVHYFIASGIGGMRGGPGESGAVSEITVWVQQNFTATTVGGTTVYDLTAPTGSSSTSA